MRSAYLKIFLNYIQLVSISNGLDLKWSDLILGYFNVNLLLSGSMLKVFSIECLFPGSNIVYLNALLMSIIPFFLFFFTILFWLAISRFRKVQLLKNLNKLVTSLVIIIFTIQPTIINCLISIISCREIDNGKFYLVSFLNEECGTSQNNLWRNFLFYPAFFFYAIALPLMPFCYIIFYRKNLYVLDRFKKVGFLFNGYMKKKFYWEFVFFYRKIVVIIIINYFTMNNPTKALLILMILLISLWLQALENPYISDDLNSIDFKATFVAFLTIFGGVLAWLSDTNESQMLMSIMIFLTNVLFVYHWFRRFLIQTLPWYLHSRYLSCIHKYLLKLQPEYDTLLAQQKNNGIMGISNSESSKLDNIPKKSSFFFSFKNAFSNLIEEPSKSPSPVRPRPRRWTACAATRASRWPSAPTWRQDILSTSLTASTRPWPWKKRSAGKMPANGWRHCGGDRQLWCIHLTRKRFRDPKRRERRKRRGSIRSAPARISICCRA